jgi:long-chain acyl-CoA synthetase
VAWSLALLRAGAVLVPVATELSVDEKRELADLIGLHAVVGALPAGEMGRERERHPLSLEGAHPVDLVFLQESAEPTDFREEDLADLNPALIRFSSGTTGRSKGVVLSHETLLARVKACNAALKIDPSDRVIWMLPMAHHFAVSILLYLYHGACTILLDSHLGEDVWGALEQHEGTVLYASPFHYRLLAAVPAARPLPCLRLAISTTAGLMEETARAFLNRFGLPLRQALGVIECGLPLVNSKPNPAWDSVGQLQTGFELRLVGPDDADVAPGETGELWLRGPGFLDAYLRPWQLRRELLIDGWFRTGDMARMEADGSVFLQGRSHSVINVGGMKCFPEEIESCLLRHHGVLEARVLAVPHPSLGAVPAAEVVLNQGVKPPTVTDLMLQCRRQLAAYKVPLKWAFPETIPRTANGKVDRKQVFAGSTRDRLPFT